jgi:hypothetical protein
LPFLELLVILQEIVDIVFAPKATDSLLAHFSSLVASFLSKLKLLYPDVRIKRKMQFFCSLRKYCQEEWYNEKLLVHELRAHEWCPQVPCHVMKNFVNPLVTLSYRRQCAAFHLLLEGRANRNFVSLLVPIA